MLTVNMDIQDHLIISQTGYVRHIKFAQGSVGKIKVKFSDKQAGLKAMKSSYLDRQNSKVPTEKCETENSKKKRITISIHQANSISINISIGIYYS